MRNIFCDKVNQVLRYYILNNFIALFKNNNLRNKIVTINVYIEIILKFNINYKTIQVN
jgi:hypothetical protein